MDALEPVAIVAIGLAVGVRARRSDIGPSAGIAMWLSLLTVRAVATVSVAVLVLAYLPETAAFQSAKAWCITAVVPLFQTRLEVGSHGIADLALLVPGVLLLVSVTSLALNGAQAARSVGAWIRRETVSRRADGSLVVRGGEPVLASAGVRRPRILITTGALAALEHDELEAGLAHERGHRDRRHGVVRLIALCLYGLARPIPGSGRAHDELHFWLERDADEYAVRSTGDRLALASAICKVASGQGMGHAHPALALAGRSAVTDRLVALISPRPEPGRLSTCVAWGRTAVLAVSAGAALVLLLAAASPVGAVEALAAHAPELALCA